PGSGERAGHADCVGAAGHEHEADLRVTHCRRDRGGRCRRACEGQGETEAEEEAGSAEASPLARYARRVKRAFSQVDVFTTRPYAGNPVAVVLDGSGLA